MSSIVSMAWVAQHLADFNVILIDCRFVLGQPLAGREAYAAAHLPGAAYFDLEQDLSTTIGEHGGRHPLPDLGLFSLKLGQAGINDTTMVIAYDDQGGAMASRFWWMLRFLGHDNVLIMDEGFTKWQEAGHPIDAKPFIPEPCAFIPRVQRHLLVSMEDVRKKLGSSEMILIDSRDAVRYSGLEDPIDRVAGHIPGAIHFFWKDSLQENGAWNNASAQKRRFETLQPEQEIIVYCGSGLTACPNIVALTEVGFKNVKLYAGSWSDWISYDENPVAKSEPPAGFTI